MKITFFYFKVSRGIFWYFFGTQKHVNLECTNLQGPQISGNESGGARIRYAQFGLCYSSHFYENNFDKHHQHGGLVFFLSKKKYWIKGKIFPRLRALESSFNYLLAINLNFRIHSGPVQLF